MQLIKADDGTHVWAENYDRELTDVFAVQEEIARAVTASLRMPLGLKPGENLVNNRKIDPDSYQQFLRAKALFHARNNNEGGRANLNNAIALVEEVVARNPDYAPAWALLSSAHNVLPNIAGLANFSTAPLGPVVERWREKAEPAARKAIELDSNLADGYVALGTVQSRKGKHLLAVTGFSTISPPIGPHAIISPCPRDPKARSAQPMLSAAPSSNALGPRQLRTILRATNNTRALCIHSILTAGLWGAEAKTLASPKNLSSHHTKLVRCACLTRIFLPAEGCVAALIKWVPDVHAASRPDRPVLVSHRPSAAKYPAPEPEQILRHNR